MTEIVAYAALIGVIVEAFFIYILVGKASEQDQRINQIIDETIEQIQRIRKLEER
jgi:hypothetical protein